MTGRDADPRRELAELIQRHGPLPFREVVQVALYGDGGFYRSGGRAGRRGDFLTSPEVGPLFGECVARALDRAWVRLGRPRRFDVVEHGAGPGTLARTVLAAPLECRDALHYTTVEPGEEQRRLHPDGVRALPEPPPGPVTGVVLANELLDNLPFDLWRRQDPGWCEVRVGLDASGTFTWQEDPPGSAPDWLDELCSACPDGALVPDQSAARAWLDARLGEVERGTVLLIDYAASTAELAGRPMTGWLRTYRAHDRGGDPLDDLGAQDITADVATDQLDLVRPPARRLLQADWLRGLGIADLVEEGRRIWAERAALGDLQALRARSRISEAEALLDPDGLGAFTVLEWDVGLDA